jgi:hypothetical protein
MKLKPIDFIKLVISWLIMGCFFTSLLEASQKSSSVDSLLTRADSLLNLKQFDDARKAYKAALKIDNDLIRAYAGLGLTDLAEEKWADAGDEYQTVLDRDPNNFDAHYYRGICTRETGKYKVLLFRKLDWDKSKKHFQWVLGRDSLYKDVIYQYALLKRYQENYKEAIQLGHAQIKLRPDLVEPQVKLFRFYRYFITHTDQPEAIDWLKQQPWDHARFASAEKFRRKGQLASADSVLMDLLNKPAAMSLQPIYLSLTRIYYAQNLQQLAEYYYWRAVNEIQNDIDASLVFEDVKYILTDQELDNYQSLNSTGEKINFFKALWLGRDPTPAASINYRLAEHYRRLIYAEKNYEFDGFRTWFNNPDKLGYLDFTRTYNLNQEFNDIGLIYIRHGQYDDWAVTIDQDVVSNQSWVYYQTQSTPKMIFHFVLENTAGYWRFTPVITDPRMLEDRLQFGNIFYRLLRSSELERLSYVEEMARESRDYVSTGLSIDRHTWEKKIKPLETPFSMSTFRGDRGKTILEIYDAFSLSVLADENENDNQKVEIEKGLAIYNLAWQEIEKYHEKISVPVRKSEWFIDLYHYEVLPDSYHVSYYLRPLETDLLGGWKYEIRVPNYSSPQLLISDIQLATRIEPTTKPGKFVKNGLVVVPNPTRFFELNKPVYIYFEIYNLTQDLTRGTSFIIEYKLTLLERKKKGLFGLFGGGGKSSISTQIKREGKGNLSIEYLAIDVSQLKAGEYNLEVKVTDQQTGKTVIQKKRIALQ